MIVSIYFSNVKICETRDHVPQFIQSGSFMLGQRRLSINDASDLVRSCDGHYHLATIHEENEHEVAQSLCADYTVNETNCWIGYVKGIINENE